MAKLGSPPKVAARVRAAGGLEMSETDALPRIPGIRVAAVMERLSVTWPILRSRLLDFAEQHEGALTELRSALDAGDLVTARGWCGTLAAAGEDIGAEGLVDKLQTLERALRTGQQFYDHFCDEAEMEFDGLIKSIKRLPGTDEDDAIRDIVAGLYDFPALRSALGELQVALRKPDWEGADRSLEAVRRLGVPPDMLEGFRELEKLVVDRMLEDALDMAGILKLNLD